MTDHIHIERRGYCRAGEVECDGRKYKVLACIPEDLATCSINGKESTWETAVALLEHTPEGKTVTAEAVLLTEQDLKAYPEEVIRRVREEAMASALARC